jgi:O-antigen/teichoic acid export membrane protein
MVLLSAAGGAYLLEAYIFRFDRFGAVFFVSVLALPFLTDISLLGGIYRGVLKAGPSIVAELIVMPSARLLFVSGLFLLGLKIWGVVIATLASSVLAALWLQHMFKVDFGLKMLQEDIRDRKEEKEEIVTVLKYSIVLAFSVGVTTLTRTLDSLFLGYFWTPSLVGQYAVAQMMMVLVSLVGAAIGQTTGAQIARRHAEGDLLGMEQIMKRQARWITLLTVPVFVLFLCWGSNMMEIFGPSFSLSAIVIGILATTQLCQSIFGPSGYALSMTGRHREELKLLCIGLVVMVLSCTWLVPRFGQTGAAGAAAISLISTNLLRVAYVYKIFRVYSMDRRLMLIIGGAAMLGGGIKIFVQLIVPSMLGRFTFVGEMFIFMVIQVLILWRLALTGAERGRIGVYSLKIIRLVLNRG